MLKEKGDEIVARWGVKVRWVLCDDGFVVEKSEDGAETEASGLSAECLSVLFQMRSQHRVQPINHSTPCNESLSAQSGLQ